MTAAVKVPVALSECPTCGKVRYPSKRDARTAIKRFQRRRGRLHAYRCTDGYWHIGHRPPNLSSGDIDRRELTPKKADKR